MRLRRNTLFVDVLSVKEFPKSLLLASLPPEVRAVGKYHVCRIASAAAGICAHGISPVRPQDQGGFGWMQFLSCCQRGWHNNACC